MRASAVIGRVGGLAVALGVGVVVGISGAGGARADTGDSTPPAGGAERSTAAPARAHADTAQRARQHRTPAPPDTAAAPEPAAAGPSAPPRPAADARPAPQRTSPEDGTRPTANGSPATTRRPAIPATAGTTERATATISPAQAPAAPGTATPATGGDTPTDTPAPDAAPPISAPASGTLEAAPARPVDVDPTAPAETAVGWIVAAAARRTDRFTFEAAATSATTAATREPAAGAQPPRPLSELTPAGTIPGPGASVSAGRAVMPAASAPSVIATINVGNMPTGVAVSPNGSRAYVTNLADNWVSVIDTATNTVIQTISVGNNPRGLAISPNGSRAYVINPSSVSVIDTATNTVIQTIGVGGSQGVAVSPNGSRAYVTALTTVNGRSFGEVSVIDTATNTVIQTVSVGNDVRGLAISPNGSRAYVTNPSSGEVSVIDTATNTVIQTIGAAGSGSQGVAISPNGSRAYVTNYSSDSVSVIDTATNTVIQTIGVGLAPEGVAVSPNGSRAYVTNYSSGFSSGMVSVIDTAANTVIQTIGVGGSSYGGPYKVAISPNGSRAYVTNEEAGTVSVINTEVAPPPPPSPSATVAVSPTTVTEGNTGTKPLSFTVTLSGPALTGGAAIPWTLTGRSTGTGVTAATAGTDFTTTATGVSLAGGNYSGTLTITAGQTRGVVTVNIVGDQTPESTEALTLTLGTTGLRGATLGATSTATATITDDDTTVVTPPTVSIANVTVSEGNSGTKNAAFTVSLSKTSTTPVTVRYATANGTATAGAAGSGGDYTAASGTLTFAANTTTQTVNVAILGDTRAEPSETFTVTLSNPSGATLGRATATGTITDDDTAASSPTVTIGPESQRVVEGNLSNRSSAKFTVALANGAKAGPAGVDVSLAYDFAGPEKLVWANRDTDLFLAPSTVRISPNMSSASFEVFFVSDSAEEPDESFKVSLETASGAVLGTSGRSVVVTIANDDAALRISDASISEGQLGTTTKMRIPVTLSVTPSSPVTVNWATSDGPASSLGATQADRDYVAGSGILTFAKDTTTLTQFIEVNVNGDTKVEQNETFLIRLSNPIGAPIARGTATGTITNDDLNNRPPVAGTPSATVNAATGRVTGNINATDPDKDTITYTEFTGTSLNGGSYTVSRNGGYTYTPSIGTRRNAGQNTPNPANFVDSFSVTVSDGRGGTTTVPVTVRVAPPLPRIYLTNSDGTVYVIRTDTDAIEATLRDPKALPGQQSGSLPLQGPAVVATSSYNTYSDSSYQPLAYIVSPQRVNQCNGVACQDSGPISVINTATNAVVGTVRPGNTWFGLEGIAVQPFRTQAGGSFTGLNAYIPGANTVTVIDPRGQNLGAITLEPQAAPTFGPLARSVAFNKTGTRAYVATERAGVYVIDTTQRIVLYSIDLPNSVVPISDIAVDAAERVYVPASLSGSPQGFGNVVYVVDTVTRQVEPITVGTSPRGIALNQAGTRAYVGNWRSNTVSIIDTTTKRVLETVPVPQSSGTGPRWIAVAETLSGPVVYVVNQGAYGCNSGGCSWTGSGVWKFNDFGTSRQPAVLNLSSYLKGPFNKWQGLAVSAW